MIKVSLCQRLLSNNACLCLFIKTLWYTWKLYRGEAEYANVYKVITENLQTLNWINIYKTSAEKLTKKHAVTVKWLVNWSMSASVSLWTWHHMKKSFFIVTLNGSTFLISWGYELRVGGPHVMVYYTCNRTCLHHFNNKHNFWKMVPLG